jgi:hypothetical protein
VQNNVHELTYGGGHVKCKAYQQIRVKADEREMCSWAISISVLVIICPTHIY